MQARFFHFPLSSRFFTTWLILLFIALLLGGCSGIRLIEDYDSVIDQGLTEYYEATDQFLSHISKSGSENGSYENNREFYSKTENKELEHNRVLKEAIHELGHSFGLKHCRNHCVMRISERASNVDEKPTDFCDSCLKALQNSQS